MRRKMMGKLFFYGGTALLILAVALTFTITACGGSREDGMKTESYYREREQELESVVRNYLNENGYADSGVALTRVVDGEGNRAYTLTIHHRRIDRMEAAERAALAKQIAQFMFAEEGCTFACRFLTAAHM
ncbi:MAG: hypothetical protein NC417_14385 [Candidatus Gastranaerophilales bacterium]|nr:hypothetical protein [Candidatus Gastranaerophilales bacterium]